MPYLLIKYLDFDAELAVKEEKSLPLFHVCSQDKLLESLNAGKIVERKECNVFKKNIIYTFYGASKYNSGNNFNNVSAGDNSACLILNIDHCINIHSIYPLDTGLASGTVAEARQYIIPWNTIQKKLNLGRQRSRINKLILHCFETIEDYIDGTVVKNNNQVKAKYIAPNTISHINDLHNIIKDQSVGDKRRYFVEVLFENEIELIPGLLIGTIASTNLLQTSDYLSLLKKFRIEKNVLDNSLFYPSSLLANGKIEEEITNISITFSKKRLAHA